MRVQVYNNLIKLPLVFDIFFYLNMYENDKITMFKDNVAIEIVWHALC